MALPITLILALTTTQNPVWPHEPAGFQSLTNFGFETVTGDGWTTPFAPYAGTLFNDLSAPISGPTGIHSYRDGTSNHGGDFYHPIPSSAHAFFMGFAIRLSNPHFGWFNGWYQKILLVANGTQHMYMHARNMFGTAFAYFQFVDQQSSGYNNPHIVTPDGVFPCNVASCRYSLGEWHKIEVYYQASTGTNSQDGKLQYWIDGTLVTSHDNVNLSPQIDDVWIANIWDSINTQLTQEEWVEYDHAYISVPGGSGSPASAPAAVSLRVT